MEEHIPLINAKIPYEEELKIKKKAILNKLKRKYIKDDVLDDKDIFEVNHT